MTLVYLLILAVVYIFLDLFMRKKAHTKMKKSYWRSFKGRRPLFITIEMVMLLCVFSADLCYTFTLHLRIYVSFLFSPVRASRIRRMEV